MRVLLVEDEPSLARIIEVELLLQGMAVDICADGRSGFEKALGDGYDVILLDWILPHVEGIHICRALRSRGLQVPIIIITAKQDVSSEVRGLSEGADDYLAKPFDMEQLVARIRAVTRRAVQSGEPSGRISSGTLMIVRDERSVYQEGARVHLTNKEYEILLLLLENLGKVVTKERIKSTVWGQDFHFDEGAIAVHIKGIRSKLKGLDIENVRGIGYLVPRPDRVL